MQSANNQRAWAAGLDRIRSGGGVNQLHHFEDLAIQFRNRFWSL